MSTEKFQYDAEGVPAKKENKYPLGRKYTLTRANTAKTSNKWQVYEYDLAKVVDIFVDPEYVHVRDQKDGKAFIAGKLEGTTRRGEAISKVDFLVFDVDGEQSNDEVKALMEAHPYHFMMYTSYNHLVSQTDIPTNKLATFCQKKSIDTKGKHKRVTLEGGN
ncbi:MAG: hypothetical protein AAGD43_09405 [Pseudomonadota bacterium]